MRVVNTAAHFGACLAEEVIPAESSATTSGRCLCRSHASRSGTIERNFVSRSCEPQTKHDPARMPLSVSPKGEGGASPFQAPNALRRKHIMKRTLSAAIVGVILAAFGVLPAHAQDLKAMLLKPANGWVMEWFSSFNKGVSEAVFEDRGGKIVAKLYIVEMGAATPAFRSCERDVVITGDAISFDGCRDYNLILIHDPSDKVYPLKTKTTSANGYDYKLKEK